ncbi:MAG TPA: NTP transferase domain-containing protein [Micromonosporaceae bacterium]
MPAAPAVAGLLLAAGAGRRYGMPKALVRHGDVLLVEHALATLRGGGCDPVVAVLGAAADEVRARADLNAATVVVNPDWATGMGSSLRTGLGALAATAAQAVVVLLVDTPGVTPAAVVRLAALAAADGLAVATYHGEPGHPVLLGRDHWAGAAELAVGDVGARKYLRQHPVREVPCDDVADGTDLDRPIRPPGQAPEAGPVS